MLRMIPIARRDGPLPMGGGPPTRIEGVIEFDADWMQARERLAESVHNHRDPDYGDDDEPEPPPELLANWSWNIYDHSWHGFPDQYSFRFYQQTVMFIFRGGQTGACKIDYIDEALDALGWERV